MIKEEKKIIDVSGFMYTGKAGVMDFLREFSCCEVHEKYFEFYLMRIQGGVLDLRSALIGNWSPIRSDAAINRFKKVVRVLGGGNTKIYKPLDWFKPTGQNYNQRFNGQFYELTNKYLDQLINHNVRIYWPFQDFENGPLHSFLIKLKNLIGIRHINKVNLSFSNKFDEISGEYINSILFSNVNNDKNIVVTSNAIEPYNPFPALDILKNASLIIVDRDPRDAFLSYIRNKKFSQSQLNIEVSNYINMYRIYHEAYKYYYKTNDRILFIQFEDFVENYMDIKNKIIEFIGLRKESHINPLAHFNPETSKLNIGMWKNNSHKIFIDKIENELKEYLIQN